MTHPYDESDSILAERPDALGSVDSLKEVLRRLYESTLGGALKSVVAAWGDTSDMTLEDAIFHSAKKNGILITTNHSTGVAIIGGGTTNTGTISAPAVDFDLGSCINVVTSGSAGGTASIGVNGQTFMRGDGTRLVEGFNFWTKCRFPDAGYDSSGASTGSRIKIGMFGNAIGTALGEDDSSSTHQCFFERQHVNGGLTDANFFLTVRNTVDGRTRVDTGMPFTLSHVFEMLLRCPRGGANVYWKIKNWNTGAVVSGTQTTGLPGANTNRLRAGGGVGSVDAVARNIQFSRILAFTA